MIVRGIVVSSDEKNICIKCSCQDACGNCSNHGNCPSDSILGALSPRREHILKLYNRDNTCFRVFQIVEVELPDSFIIRSSLLVYLVSIIVSIIVSVFIDCVFSNEFVTIMCFILCIIAQLFLYRLLAFTDVKNKIKIIKK